MKHETLNGTVSSNAVKSALSIHLFGDLLSICWKIWNISFISTLQLLSISRFFQGTTFVDIEVRIIIEKFKFYFSLQFSVFISFQDNPIKIFASYWPIRRKKAIKYALCFTPEGIRFNSSLENNQPTQRPFKKGFKNIYLLLLRILAVW